MPLRHAGCEGEILPTPTFSLHSFANAKRDLVLHSLCSEVRETL